MIKNWLKLNFNSLYYLLVPALLILIVLNYVVLSYVHHLKNSSWTHNTYLDPQDQFHLSWKLDEVEKEIEFLVEVRTLGWVGLGLSPSGGMGGSDIVIAWVNDDDGKVFFDDRHALGSTLPIRDEQQDWHLIYATQNITHTIIQFSRPFVTCDEEHDVPIVDGSMKVIYAYGQSDPKSIDGIAKHSFQERGTKTINLLQQSQETKDKTLLESDTQVLDLINDNLEIPANDTTYWCKLFKMNFPVKRHVIKYDAIITPGNEAFTHHFVLFSCAHPNPSQLEKYLNQEGHPCTDELKMPLDWRHCQTMIMIWSVGSEPFFLPQEAGYPFGLHSSDTTYVLLQSHYDNPELLSGRRDSSGLRLWHTGNLRQFDAGTFILGSRPDYKVLIPPRQKEYKVVTHCHPRCFEDHLPESLPGINIFASMLHGHQIVKKLRVRHFRGDEELPWIDNNQNFDFNIQSFHALKKAVLVERGDRLTTECIYDSRSRKKATLGGVSSRDEMCNVFVSYYPILKTFKRCYSNVLPSVLMAISNVEEIGEYHPNISPRIILPKNISNMTLAEYFKIKDDWDDELVAKSAHLLQYAKQRATCYRIKTPDTYDFNDLIGYPVIKQEYKPAKLQCKK